MATFALPVGKENTFLGSFGENWFQTVCVAAGCSAAKPSPDVVGADFLVHDQGCELIRVQVKTTENPTVVDGTFRYPLDVHVYDRLREGTTAGYLVLVVVSAPHPKWTRHFHRGSVVAAGIYWVCVASCPETLNTDSITMSLPFVNMLTPARLQSLFPGGE